MTLVKWDPFQDLRSFERRLGEALGSASASLDAEGNYGSWAPAVDILEKGDDLVIRAELAGINRDDIDIRVENGTLMLRGERKPDKLAEEGKVYRSERAYGVFVRRFSLPTTVDAGAIKATHTDGVLEIVLPKSEGAKPKRVEISAA